MSMMRAFVFACLLLPAASASAQPVCAGTPLTNQQVKGIIDRERAARSDLPPAYPDARWEYRRDGCYYVAIEQGTPAAPDYRHVFKLNPQGVIVDVEPGSPRCPDTVFSDGELTDIVRAERAKRRDLPPAFSNPRIRVDRERCLYLYFEYAVPESRGNHHVFIIDPLGGVMSVQRAQPY